MKRFLLYFLAMALSSGCALCPREPRVMARAVPERADDFVWENNLVCYRAYGEALEKEMVSPGFDVWVKRPGALVADKRYDDDLHGGKSYHKDWGDGKDCYKVGRTLGGGASALFLDGRPVFPPTNYRSYEILEQKADRMVFVLHYPEWETPWGGRASLDKKITVIPDSYFCKAEDLWKVTGAEGKNISVCAGIARHDIVREGAWEDRFFIWEHASDTGAEPEDGLLGLALCMSGTDGVALSADGEHSLCSKTLVSGETAVIYYFASCWSKGDVGTPEEWAALVEAFEPF